LIQHDLETAAQYPFIKQVHGANAHPGNLVGKDRANPFSGSADGILAPGLFLQPIQKNMVGHDDMGPMAQEQFTHRHTMSA